MSFPREQAGNGAGSLETLLSGLEAVCRDALHIALEQRLAFERDLEEDLFKFDSARKDLLPRMEQCLMGLRSWRRKSDGCLPCERETLAAKTGAAEVIHSLVTRYLLADNDIRRALQSRGTRGACKPRDVAAQHPHCVADLYRCHSRS